MASVARRRSAVLNLVVLVSAIVCILMGTMMLTMAVTMIAIASIACMTLATIALLVIRTAFMMRMAVMAVRLRVAVVSRLVTHISRGHIAFVY